MEENNSIVRMEDMNCKPETYSNYNGVCGPIRYMRDVPPAHYTFKIESFSLLLKTQVEKFDSGDFESGGYKWRLSIYPNGDKTRDGDGYISVYLAISDADTFPLGWEVFTNFRLFVFNQMHDKYLTVEDDIGCMRRFHGMKREWGFSQLLSLDAFKNDGYLVRDSCAFGVEVFVLKCSSKWGCLSMVKPHVTSTFTWKIDNFLKLDKEYYHSEVFTIGDANWKLGVYPKGFSTANGKALSVYLILDNCQTLPPNRKLYAEYTLRIRDQVKSIHHEFTDQHWFSASSSIYGNGYLLMLSDLNQASKGFLKKGTLIVEAQILVMSVLKDYP